jgi:hypothetical protein
MPGTLRLSVQRDTDGTLELFVEAAADGFGGRASAWFAEQQLADFAEQLNAFPICADGPPVLEGGFWSQEGHGLEQAHVQLKVVPIDRRGTLAVQVRLATPTWPDDRPDSQRRAALEVRIDYALLQEFSRSVAQLATGHRDEALLESSLSSS